MNFLFNLIRFAILFVIVDSIYLFSTSKLSGRVIADVQRVALQLKPLGAVIVYLAIAFSYLTFARDGKSITKAFLLGATTYAIFDFTNYAMFKKYPLWFAIMDTIWGGILFSIVAFIDKKWL